MATEIWVNLSSGNGLQPDAPKIPQPSTTENKLKISDLKFISNLTGANELMSNMSWLPVYRYQDIGYSR